MPIIILLMYLATLALALTYSIGGVGLGLLIVLGIAAIITTVLFQIRRDEHERAAPGPGHHHDAHGGVH